MEGGYRRRGECEDKYYVKFDIFEKIENMTLFASS
jgi:hypothetical protein